MNTINRLLCFSAFLCFWFISGSTLQGHDGLQSSSHHKVVTQHLSGDIPAAQEIVVSDQGTPPLDHLSDWINNAFLILSGILFTYFVYNSIKYVISKEADRHEPYRKHMIRDFVILFVVVAVWGLVAFLSSTLGIGLGLSTDGIQAGDEISIGVELGNPDSLSVETFKFEIGIDCEDFVVDPQSQLTLDLSNSWFGNEQELIGQVWTENEGALLRVSLLRADSSHIAGHGEVVTIKGVIVQNPESNGNSERRVNNSPAFSVRAYPNPFTEYVVIEPSAPKAPFDFLLMDPAGRIVQRAHQISGPQKIGGAHLPAGNYSLLIQQESSTQTFMLLHQ
ncbi:MAG: hypothetical protein AAFR61_22090 [Bacteroidota bacterium]